MNGLFEMHYHTSQTSTCGHVSAADSVRAYRKQGYDGIITTDHFYRSLLEGFGEDLDWSRRIDRWLEGYRLARRTGEREGLVVLLGMELRFDHSPNDYLVYGWTEDLLKTTPEPYAWNEERFHAFAQDNGLFFAQAHPFRPHLTRCPAAYLDGMEVFNGNLRHDSHDSLAAAFAEEHGLIPLCGSDLHEWEDLRGVGMTFYPAPANSPELIRRLRDGRFALCRGETAEKVGNAGEKPE